MSSKACTVGGSTLPPTAPEERNRSATAPLNPYATPGLGGVAELAATKARSALQRLDGSGWDLQRELEGTWAQSRLIVRTRECGRCSDGACLRARLALIFGKAKRCRCECLSGDATHLHRHPRPVMVAAQTPHLTIGRQHTGAIAERSHGQYVHARTTHAGL